MDKCHTFLNGICLLVTPGIRNVFILSFCILFLPFKSTGTEPISQNSFLSPNRLSQYHGLKRQGKAIDSYESRCRISDKNGLKSHKTELQSSSSLKENVTAVWINWAASTASTAVTVFAFKDVKCSITSQALAHHSCRRKLMHNILPSWFVLLAPLLIKR